MNKNEAMIQGYLAGYMQKEAAGTPMMQSPAPQQAAMPGQGMGEGLPAQGEGFALNPEMAANAEQDVQDAEAQEREAKLGEMSQELDELKYASKEQKITGDIMKEKLKIKKQQESMDTMAAAETNDASLGAMISQTSPGE